MGAAASSDVTSVGYTYSYTSSPLDLLYDAPQGGGSPDSISISFTVSTPLLPNSTYDISVSNSADEITNWSASDTLHGITLSGGAEPISLVPAPGLLAGGALIGSGAIFGGAIQTNSQGQIDQWNLVADGATGYLTYITYDNSFLGQQDAFGSVQGGGDQLEVNKVNGGAGQWSVAAAYVISSGVATGFDVGSGVSLTVLSGGISSDSIVSGGGTEIVSAGGIARGTTVSGGEMQVLSGGTAIRTTVLSGGTEVVYAGGTAKGLVDDGSVVVSGSTTLRGSLSGSGALTETGSGDLVLRDRGAGFTGEAVINGGTIELATRDALGDGSVVFSGATASNVLQIDTAGRRAMGRPFSNVISNFSGSNDFIDLRSIAYVLGASASVAKGILTLADGHKKYRFEVAGSVGASFEVTSDGHGGTLIEPRAAAFIQTMASLHGRLDPGFATVHSGGTALTTTPPMITAATSGR